MKRLRLLVVCGGKSAEREVSLKSASAVLRNLDPRRYSISVAVIDPSGRWTVPAHLRQAGIEWDPKDPLDGHNALSLDPAKGFEFSLQRTSGAAMVPDVVFPVLHGPNGEDGTVQGMLELAGIAYVGCGVLGSALAMDKEFSKRLAAEAGIDILPYAVLRSPEALRKRGRWEAAVARLGYPLFVKPARLGSSVGITKVVRRAGLLPAVREAFRFDDKVLVESGIAAREIEVGVLGDADRAEASGCGEVRPRAEFYDYKAKYEDPEGAELLIPAPLPKEVERKAREWAIRVFQALDGHGMSRVDFLLDKESGRLYFNEMNTIPGFTAISLYPRLWAQAGVSFSKLLDRLIELAVRRRRLKAGLSTRHV